jgi:hypothetical protein
MLTLEPDRLRNDQPPPEKKSCGSSEQHTRASELIGVKIEFQIFSKPD